MKYSLKEAGMPYQYILIQPLYIVLDFKSDNSHCVFEGVEFILEFLILFVQATIIV